MLGAWGRVRHVATIRPRRRVVAMWGNGDHGRLGLASTTSFSDPRFLALDNEHPCDIACGGAHTLILTESGRIFATGLNDHGQLGLPLKTRFVMEPKEVSGLPDPCVRIATGYYHSAAITEAGDVFIWGDNRRGQLGLGKGTPSSVWKPALLEALKGLPPKMLAFGAEHSLALTEDGEVLSWGDGKYGQLGHGQRNNIFRFLESSREYTPRLIQALHNKKMITIDAGLSHSACIDEHGTVYTFGKEEPSHTVNKQKAGVPCPILNLPPAQQIACGGHHIGAVTRMGDLYMWGSNEHGCLGLGDRQSNGSREPMRVEGKLATVHVQKVSCGWKHSAALSDGKIFMWGWGGSYGSYANDGESSGGQLGLGNEFDYLEPSPISFSNTSDNLQAVIQVSCGFNHSGAVVEI